MSLSFRVQHFPLRAVGVLLKVYVWGVVKEIQIDFISIICPTSKLKFACLDVKRKIGHINLQDI